MSTILWMQPDLAQTTRRSKRVFAVVRFFAPGFGFSKDMVDATQTQWVQADVLGLVKDDGPARAWITFAEFPKLDFTRYSHSLFVVIPVEELSRVDRTVDERTRHSYNVTKSSTLKDHDGHAVQILTVY